MNISKPQTAYHFYISKMPADWNNLTEEEKKPFIEQDEKDSMRYKEEIQFKKQLEYEKTKGKKDLFKKVLW